MKQCRGDRGSATILALLITGVIITVGIGFNWIVKEHLKAAEGMKRKAEAHLKAISTYDTLIYCVLAGRSTPAGIVFNASEDLFRVKSLSFNGAGVTVSDDVEIKIQDSNGLISLASPNLIALQRLLRNANPVEDNSAVIIDSYLDWITKGNLARINGAKEAYYAAEGKPYTTRNYPMQYKEEFAFLRGMDRELYKKVSPSLTLLPNLGFNPNTAPDEVLQAYLGIDKDSLQTLKSYISQTPVDSNPALFKTVGRTLAGEGTDFYPAPFIEITINVGKPETVYSIKAGIDTRGNATYPYSVIYWEKG